MGRRRELVSILLIAAICSCLVNLRNPNRLVSSLRQDDATTTTRTDAHTNHNATKVELPTIIKKTIFRRIRNETLVILIGDLRCGEAAWESLYRNVLDVNQADLALFTHEPRDDFRNSSLLDRSVHTERIPYYTDWSDVLDLMVGSDAWREVIHNHYPPSSHKHILGGIPDYEASGAIVNSFKWFVLQSMKREGWLDVYKRFIVTRTDQYYSCRLDLSRLDSQYVWVPDGEDYLGINDRYVIFSADKAEQTLNTMEPFLRDPLRYKKKLHVFRVSLFLKGKLHFFPNCELFLMIMWKESNLWESIRRFPRVMHCCKHPNDTTRWGDTMGYSLDTGLAYKYEMEYKAAVRTCRNK